MRTLRPWAQSSEKPPQAAAETPQVLLLSRLRVRAIRHSGSSSTVEGRALCREKAGRKLCGHFLGQLP